MTLELYVAFIAATALLVLTPGPMVAFVTATTLSRGLGHGLVAVIGSTLASAIQLGVVALGLTAILNAASEAFFWLKWIGVAYLVFLAFMSFRTPADNLGEAKPKTTAKRTFLEAFFVNLTNPKGILFHGAFLPLFISPNSPAGPQLALLAVTFLIVAAALDCCWALFAARLQPIVARAGRWRHRVTGGILLSAAVGLAFVRKA